MSRERERICVCVLKERDRLDGRLDGRPDRCLDGRLDGCQGGRLDGRLDGRPGRCPDGRLDEELEEQNGGMFPMVLDEEEFYKILDGLPSAKTPHWKPFYNAPDPGARWADRVGVESPKSDTVESTEYRSANLK